MYAVRQELLRGPLFYVLIMTAVTAVFWRESPVGMMVLSLMCGGDGLADIVGRKFGAAKLPFNKSKSWAGSLAMFAGKLQSWLQFCGCSCRHICMSGVTNNHLHEGMWL